MSIPGDEPTRIDPPGEEPTRVLGSQGPGGWDDGGPPPVGPPVGGPPTGPDGRVWIIVALVAVVGVLLAVLLLGGDDDEDDPTGAVASTPSSTSTSTSSTTSSTAAPSTSAAPTTAAPATTTAPAGALDLDECEAAGADPGQPGRAAQQVFEAWTQGDEACADLLMTDSAQAELFSRDGSGAVDSFEGCTEVAEPDVQADCAFAYRGGATHYRMAYSPTDGWQVVEVDQTAD